MPGPLTKARLFLGTHAQMHFQREVLRAPVTCSSPADDTCQEGAEPPSLHVLYLVSVLLFPREGWLERTLAAAGRTLSAL